MIRPAQARVPRSDGLRAGRLRSRAGAVEFEPDPCEELLIDGVDGHRLPVVWDWRVVGDGESDWDCHRFAALPVAEREHGPKAMAILILPSDVYSVTGTTTAPSSIWRLRGFPTVTFRTLSDICRLTAFSVSRASCAPTLFCPMTSCSAKNVSEASAAVLSSSTSLSSEMSRAWPTRVGPKFRL